MPISRSHPGTPGTRVPSTGNMLAVYPPVLAPQSQKPGLGQIIFTGRWGRDRNRYTRTAIGPGRGGRITSESDPVQTTVAAPHGAGTRNGDGGAELAHAGERANAGSRMHSVVRQRQAANRLELLDAPRPDEAGPKRAAKAVNWVRPRSTFHPP